MIRFEQAGALVTLRFQPPYEAGDERAYLDALGRIGDCGPGFVLLAALGGGARLSQATEREQALWFKATRSHVTQNCRAIALVRPGAGERMTETFRKLWDIPLATFADESAAMEFLARHMPAPPAGGRADP